MRSLTVSNEFKKSLDNLLKVFSKKRLSKKTDPYVLLPTGEYAKDKGELLSNRLQAVVSALLENRSVDNFFSPHPLKGKSYNSGN